MDEKQVYGALNRKIDSIATGFKSAKTNADGSITVTFIDGSSVTTNPIKGDKGEQGEAFTYDDFTEEQLEALKVKGDKGDKGAEGEKGVGIELVTKTGSTGIVDNYEILFTDGTITNYTIVNGANITKLSELENDEEFIKANTINLTNYYLKTEAYSKAQIDELLRNVGAGLSVKIVATLPEGEEISGTTIYLINTSGSNYNQYMYIDGSWANLGSTEVDMTSYYNKTQIDTKLEDYVTANRLTNKLDDYVEKSKLSKVGKTNSYNDLDDLPAIPDVEGIKPYTNELQDSENTAPTSKALFDAVQGINTVLEDKADKTDLDDYAKGTDVDDLQEQIDEVAEDISELNVNLGVLEESVKGKADKDDLGKQFTLTDFNFNPTTVIPNGVQKSLPFTSAFAPSGRPSDNNLFVGTLEKQQDSLFVITTTDYSGTTYKRNWVNGTWSAWRELATMDNVVSINNSTFKYLYQNTNKEYLTTSGKSFTANKTGLLQVIILKEKSGNSLNVAINGVNKTSYANYFGENVTITLVTPVKQGDTIKISDDVTSVGEQHYIVLQVGIA